MRGRSYIPSPPRGYGRRGRSPNPGYCYSPRHSRSPSPLSRYARSSSRDYYSPMGMEYSRSVSPEERSYMWERSCSRSPERQCSVPYNGSRSCSQTPERDHSPPDSWSCSRSLVRRAYFPQSRSRSPEGWSRNYDARECSWSPEMDESPRY